MNDRAGVDHVAGTTERDTPCSALPSIYFELLSFWRLVLACWRHPEVRRGVLARRQPIRYVDASTFVERILRPLLRAIGIEMERLNFEMRDIKDSRGELVRIRIAREDLFELRDAILESEEYRTLAAGGWQCGRLRAYVAKELADAVIMREDSPARALYVMAVVERDAHRSGSERVVFVMRARPWWNAYRRQAKRYSITVIPLDPLFPRPRRSSLRRLMYRVPRAYTILRRSSEVGRIVTSTPPRRADPKLYLEGRGDVNLANDGYHSDFFWLLNSAFPPQRVVYRHHSDEERAALVAHGITLDNGGISLAPDPAQCRRQIPRGNGRRERRALRQMRDEYRSMRAYWRSVFRANDIKIWLTWARVESTHMPAADAVMDNGGISVSWPASFDGFRGVENLATANVQFTASFFAAEIARQSGATWNYNVITGHPRDYAGALLRQEAAALRQRLLAAGAKRILFVIDENSLDDSRWHTGHALQRENYSAVLMKMLETPWLGAVFKPKVARTLRRRLGEVDELLRAAEATGRCYVFEQSGRHTTSAPPLLAGLVADVCIHAHLSSGTAGLECALEGMPTLLIDREGVPDSKFYDLPVGKVIFQSWSDALDATMDHFSRPAGIPGFGDWSPIIDELDPFRDGLAAHRMGTYLQWLLEGFQQGKGRDVVMAEAADRYRAQWGADKVLE